MLEMELSVDVGKHALIVAGASVGVETAGLAGRAALSREQQAATHDLEINTAQWTGLHSGVALLRLTGSDAALASAHDAILLR